MTKNYQSEDVWSRTSTINGHPVDEVRSVFQKKKKPVRRGWLEQAILAAYELHQSGIETEDLSGVASEIIATEEVGFGLCDGAGDHRGADAQRPEAIHGSDRALDSMPSRRSGSS